MTRAAARATEAADALLEWLRTQPAPAFRRPGAPDPLPARSPAAETDVPPVPDAAGLGEHAGTDTVPGESTSVAQAADTPAPDATSLPVEPRQRPSAPPDQSPDGSGAQLRSPLRLSHTDWLHHRLTISGPAADVAAFRAAAAGGGTIPWQLDLDRMEEDLFHLLVAPPAPQQRTLSLAGARILAGQLREAVRHRHELAVARIGPSQAASASRTVAVCQACPFDLHALVPVSDDILRLGPDDPASLAWLWTHWGTTQALRQVAEDILASPGRQRPAAAGEGAFHLTFWSADWTPWRALAQLAARWPALRFDTRPIYEAP